MTKPNERRKHLRVPVKLETVVEWDGKKIPVQGLCENLSAKGLYCSCDPRPEIETLCAIVLRLGDERYFPSIRLQGKVVRRDDHGVGIQLTGIDFRDFEHLKNMIIYSADDPEAAEKEFRLYLDLYRLDPSR